MFMSLLFWVLLVLVALSCVVVSDYYVKSRTVSTKLLALACKEFFDNADKLLKTPEDLPDSVLEGLNTMSEFLDSGKGSRALLLILRKANSDLDQGKHPSELRKDLTKMRPELQEIFGCAVAGWLNFVTHRHFVLQQRIMIELTKMAIKQEHSGINERDAGISALERFRKEGVAC